MRAGEEEVKLLGDVCGQVVQDGLLLPGGNRQPIACEYVCACMRVSMCTCLRASCHPLLRQQPHARGAQDVQRRLLVFVLGDVGGGEAQQRVEVVAGLGGRVGQGGDS